MLMADRKYDEAETLLSNLIAFLEKQESECETNTHLVQAYNSMGLILYKKVEFNKAISFYNKAIKASPTFGPSYYNRGLIYYRLGSFETAKQDIENAVRLEPKNPEFAFGLQEVINSLNSYSS
ncbi:hypothetical protein JTE90_028537 [Oedothorax gibbosus]|uniref:Tetratricopeptide repeat protein n=1 Tax=Oedothorax gibbosus TaxID=931172 RepID=A0AAV6VUL5_9ARAC|nr:hypothetical protein JTE90_028537 [Oedothorax gibbosus]